MSLAGSDGLSRLGELRCGCSADLRAGGSAFQTGALAGGFGLTVLSQALLLGSLPLVGAALAPSSTFAGAPSAAMLAGAALGAWPAAAISRRLGRSAALACGAGIGAVGGAVLAWSLLASSFAGALAGAAALGAAQGAGTLYRHAASGRPGGAGALAPVFGAGIVAGLAGPALAGWAEAAWSPHLFVGTVLVASLAHLATLALALAVPAAVLDPDAGAGTGIEPHALLGPTLAGALAWGAMTALMVSTPLAMAACGISPVGVGGAVAWHVVAMYAPAVLIGPAVALAGVRGAAVTGLAAIALAGAGLAASSSAPAFSAALFVLGAGWGLATMASGLWLHRAGRPSPSQLAVHDATLFASALAGALAAPLLAA